MAEPDISSAERRRQQVARTVQIALIFTFAGALLGIVFGILLDDLTGPENINIIISTVVTGSLMLLMWRKPALAFGAIPACLSIYFVFYINVGTVLAFIRAEELVAVIPFVTWVFPVVLFHRFTNLGFHKRTIGFLVNLSPVPAIAFVLFYATDPLPIDVIGAVLAYALSFSTFVLFVDFFTRHRDEEMLRVAMAEETERNAAALRLTEERFRLLGLATRDLIWDADLKLGRIWWSDTLRDIYGYEPQSLALDMSAWESWLHPDDRERVTGTLGAALAGNESNWSSEYRIIRADGRIVDVIDRGFILRDKTGAPIRMIGSTANVTELRELEKRLRQSQKMEAVGQLTGGIAHDFNNLLTIIIGNAEALSEIHTDHPRAKRLAEMTMQAAERGANLTSQLLSFARRQPLAPVLVSPGKLLQGIEGLICRTINADITIEMRIADDVDMIEVDPSQLENAILNLAINARDAMPDGGRLLIEASNLELAEDDLPRFDGMKAGAHVMIAVSDTGLGMPAEVRERAFEPFYTTKEIGKGSGLGLSMVWGFVQQSHGCAQIHSAPGEGTSIRLLFPAAAA